MGRPIKWQYAVVWTPGEQVSHGELFRISNAGHRFLWARTEMRPSPDSQPVADVLQQLYIAVLELMEEAGTVDV